MSKKKESLPRLALVEWDDAWSASRKVDITDQGYYEVDWPSFTAGFVGQINGKRVVIYKTYVPGFNYKDKDKPEDPTVAKLDEGWHIPRKMIRRITFHGEGYCQPVEKHGEVR